MVKIMVLALVSILFLTRDAYAYLDPSGGSIMAQVLLGGMAGFGILLKMYWVKIKLALGLCPKNSPSRDSR